MYFVYAYAVMRLTYTLHKADKSAVSEGRKLGSIHPPGL